jgi:hypothetical protein
LLLLLLVEKTYLRVSSLKLAVGYIVEYGIPICTAFLTASSTVM